MRYAFFMLTFLLGLNLAAQEPNDTSATEELWSFGNSKKIFKVSPLDIFSLVPTLGLDVELSLKKRKSLQIGAAVIPFFMQPLSGEFFNDYDRMGGYRLRAEGRLYMPVKTKFYFAAGLSFRHLIIRDEVPIGMEGVESDLGQIEFAYFQNTPMVFNRFNTNFDFKWGLQLETKANYAFDFYCGLSMRNVFVQSKSDIPEGGRVADQGGSWTLENGHSMVYPLPIFGVKIGIIK